MGFLLLIITGLIYGAVASVILFFIDWIIGLFGTPTILEQPFIVDILQRLGLPVESFTYKSWSCTKEIFEVVTE